MKKFTFTVLIATLLNVANVFAQDCDYSGTTGQLSWCLKDGTLTISGEGAIPNYTYSDATPWCEYRESITIVVVGNDITSIGNYAFSQCENLVSATISDNVTIIGNYAFSTCSSLTSITIPDGVTIIGDGAFNSCTSLTSITFPNSVIKITLGAFSGCNSLTSVNIPYSVTIIGAGVFANCSSLASISVDELNQNYSSEDGFLFNKTKTTLNCYPAGKTNTTYNIPNSIIRIEPSAFSGCNNLISVTIPNGVESIGNDAFGGCSSLTSIAIPNSVTTIGSWAFNDCSSLISVTIGNSVEYIGYYPFGYCTSLTSIDVESENNHYASENGVLFNKNKTTLVCYPAGKTTEAYDIPNGVIEVGDRAFGSCANLTSVTLPIGVTTIGYMAFVDCINLASITIANSVIYYCDWAFYNCTGLTLITNFNPVPAEVYYGIFWNVNQSECTLEVPINSVSAYKNAETWKEFKIVGIEVGIETITNDELQITVYPNPTEGVLHVETQCIASLQNIEVFDVMGRMVYTVKTRLLRQAQQPLASLQDDTTTLDISHLPSGIYFVRIQTEDGAVVRKVVKN